MFIVLGTVNGKNIEHHFELTELAEFASKTLGRQRDSLLEAWYEIFATAYDYDEWTFFSQKDKYMVKIIWRNKG
jgi:hypothetical protein